MHKCNKIILSLILFGYPIISFGAHKEIQLHDIKLNGKALTVVTYPDSFPADIGAEESAKVEFNDAWLQLKQIDQTMHTFTNLTINDYSLTLQQAKDLLTTLKDSPFSVLRLSADSSESYQKQYKIDHASVLSAAKKFNSLLTNNRYDNHLIEFSNEEQAILMQIAAQEARKNKNSNFLLLIPIIGGTAVVALVGPAMLLANLAALGASLIAVLVSFSVVIFSIGTTIALTTLGAVLPFVFPILTLRDLFFK